MGEIFDVESLCRCDGANILNRNAFTSLDRDLRMVVLPELSSPIMIIFSYFLPLSFENMDVNIEPILYNTLFK